VVFGVIKSDSGTLDGTFVESIITSDGCPDTVTINEDETESARVAGIIIGLLHDDGTATVVG
jgi:hypothetical protein